VPIAANNKAYVVRDNKVPSQENHPVGAVAIANGMTAPAGNAAPAASLAAVTAPSKIFTVVTESFANSFAPIPSELTFNDPLKSASVVPVIAVDVNVVSSITLLSFALVTTSVALNVYVVLTTPILLFL
jgi:hypothetical protein